METLNWIGELSIGVEALDREHRVLAQAIDELHSAVMKDDQRSLIGPLLRKVVDITRSHFSSEEAMMTAEKYPGLVLHLFKHQDLLQQVEALAARVKRGGFTLNEHWLIFLRDWFSAHIQDDDLQFATWLNDSGKR